MPTSSSASSRVATIVLLASATLTVMAGATIAPSLPSLLAHFADDPRAARLVPLILTAPGLAIALTAPFVGVILDRASKRNMLVGAILLYAVAGSSGLYLSSLDTILVGRVVLGIAVGVIMTASVALVADLFDGARRAAVMGWQGASMSFGGMLFVGTGGVLAELGWRVPFAIYLAPLVLVPMALAALPARSARHATATSGHSAAPQGFPWRHAAPLYALGALSMLAFYVVPTLIAFVVEALTDGEGAAARAGLAIGAATLFGGLAALGYRNLHGHLPFAAIASLSLGLLASGFVLVWAADGFVTLLVGLAIAGAGSGLTMPNNIAWLLSRVPDAMSGRASGGMTAAIFTGQFSSGIVGPILLDAFGLQGVYLAMAILAGGLALIAALAWARATSATIPAVSTES